MSSWYECTINAEGIRTGEMFKFKALCVKAFQLGNFPKDAAVFTEAVFGNEEMKFWVSPRAAKLLEKDGVDLNRWQAKESGPPPRAEAALLAGHHQFAWELFGK